MKATNAGLDPRRWRTVHAERDDLPSLFDNTRETYMLTKVIALSLEAGRTNLQPGDAAAIEEAFFSLLDVLKIRGVQVRRSECDVRDEVRELGIAIRENVRETQG